MKKLAVTLAAAMIMMMVIALTGCGTDSTSPLLTYVARASSDSYAPHLFILNATTQQSTAVAIPIPASAFHVASNSDATKVVYTRNDSTASGVYSYYPQFSPDGKSVSFFLYVSGCNCAPQHRQGATEEASRLHAQNSYPAAAVRASVGAQVATPTTGWYTMALTATTPTLAYATTNLRGPAVYSGDGKKLLMTYYDGSHYNISSINLDGTGLAPL